MIDDSIPRIYTSFAEFERDELRRLGLTAWPTPVEPPPPAPAPETPTPALAPAPAPAPAPTPAIVPVLPAAVSLVPPSSRPIVTPASLRAEGVLEIGCVHGTSVLYVRTHVKLHLLHTTWLPDRRLDDYAVSLAVTWIEDHGLPSYAVADNLGVSDATLRNALTAAGYERLNPKQQAALAIARSARKLGNRRGRLVRSNTNMEARA